MTARGKIYIDEGAYKAMTRKSKAGLLPAGVIAVEGHFSALQAVTLVVAKRRPPSGESSRDEEVVDGVDWSTDPLPVGMAVVNYASNEVARIRGLQTSEISKVLGYADSESIAHRGQYSLSSEIRTRIKVGKYVWTLVDKSCNGSVMHICELSPLESILRVVFVNPSQA